jgi:hypothetical protein
LRRHPRAQRTGVDEADELPLRALRRAPRQEYSLPDFGFQDTSGWSPGRRRPGPAGCRAPCRRPT